MIGLRDVPGAGDTFTVVETERKAREIAEQRTEEQHSKGARTTAVLTLEDVYTQAQAGKVHSLNLILKADVQGSLEPIRNSLQQIEVKDLSVDFVHEGVGTIAESDVMLAVASSAVIIGFSVGVDPSAERLAEAEGVDIRIYDIIYRVIEDVEKALTGMLEPEYEDVLQGTRRRAPGLQHHPRGDHRRLLRSPRGAACAVRPPASCARASWCIRGGCLRSSGSPRMCVRSAPAWSAASASTGPTTFRSMT